MNVPRCMSTQHPDNVNPPFFASGPELGGEDEIKEAYYVFSHLGCDEQMWDCEGKEVDSYVVKKLLTEYESFFRENILGEDCRLTLRVPNPTVERAEAKILLETLESIPRSYDTAALFYERDVPPVFEVILPMTASSRCLNRVYHYYRDFVAGKENLKLKDDVTVGEWIGEFRPEEINVIPLFEDMDGMLAAGRITAEYLEGKDPEHQRVFLARSDPAMNYGMIPATLLNKVALQSLGEVEEETSVMICPIIGMGSAPFRGNLKPSNTRAVEDYPGAFTFTVQSSFKFDHPPAEVSDAVRLLREHKPGKPQDVDRERIIDIVNRYSSEYRRHVMRLADMINRVSRHVPGRRKRKLHIGLFGYSRSMGGVSLPRAITFTAALYSIGVPPEILGFSSLTDPDLDYIMEIYPGFERDFHDALRYMNPHSPHLPPELRSSIEEHFPDISHDPEHVRVTDEINHSLALNRTGNLQGRILEAASIRKFLG
ncbi:MULTISPECIES: phosphoenolpyruvate carboxylase [Methanothermobacter]|uniref:Phosphoenolpyruvate carboxylase n=1 Tax=Methanothermobacter wolfeii TaxID=145261 RepID=A0A9E7RS33_METWO|nr:MULTISPECIES: phosphoenolpyruvate carboxylase [Methanothermobacter]NLM01896.1 phosphoenolpyruvate carboxylase [Methanothermobacter wolfeii]QHN06692.1 phosphoenolpyruvate carboxylase [Methanothermobacter sp. THM-1]UXH31233.1 phosphoenolpyruvate carboxylase [Methanothermobacter wolfeii]